MDTICKQSKKHFLTIFSLLFLSFFLSINPVSAQDGEKIFKQNCAVCHSLGSNTITGPAVAQRRVHRCRSLSPGSRPPAVRMRQRTPAIGRA